MDTYEKKYNEALEDMRIIYPNLKGDAKLAVEHAFPQLRESEDEKVRKCLIAMVNATIWDSSNLASKKACLAWLEKQKESLHISESCKENADSFTDGERIRKELIEYLRGDLDDITTDDTDRWIAWIEKQKEQKPAEWSEEDEDMLNSCISSIEEAKENRYAYKETDGDTSYDHEIAWLKSLRPSWKPSEEQLSALLAVFNDPDNICSQTCQLALTDLYEQLKKL